MQKVNNSTDQKPAVEGYVDTNGIEVLKIVHNIAVYVGLGRKELVSALSKGLTRFTRSQPNKVDLEQYNESLQQITKNSKQ